MRWICSLSHEAEKQLKRFPRNIQEHIASAIDELEEDPFRGDVVPLKGKTWKGFRRKRVGRYRIIFIPDHSNHVVEVSAILVRDEKTYR